MEIKDTLLTPKTKFSMKANLTNREKNFQKDWIDNQVLEQREKLNKNKKEFILLDGPPYANGELHVGHAMNKILKDFIWRYKSMSGYNTQIIIGWDTHGLPIENALLKKGKVKRDKLTDVEFRQKCEEYALKQVENQKESFLSLGLLTNGQKVYKTLDKKYEAEQIRVFGQMIDKGIVYKGLKPVYWSPSSQSALAEAEVEYYDKESPAIYVGFDMLSEKFCDVQIVIWTTTPWTIPANQGVCIGPNFEYSVIEISNKKYLLATSLIDSFLKDINQTEYKIVSIHIASELENIELKHPLFDQKSFIMLGNHVTLEAGTGCVHTAPGHGEDDFIISKKYHIPVISVIDAKGVMTSDAGIYEGLFYEKANSIICEDLEKKNHLINLTFITHQYPHDWRTKKPIIYRATDQWFASIKKIKKDLLDAISDVNWINTWGEVRLSNMIKGRDDWCISRQRKWGVPIPIIYTEEGNPILDQVVINHIADLFEKEGSNVWFGKDAIELLPIGYTHVESPNSIFTKETDIMDVWFDSGVAHSSVSKNKMRSYQADLVLEGSDQYRGWFNSSLITGVVSQGKAPYKSVLSHGFINDNKGNKMSKSLGNVITPKEVVNNHGADILRLWVASVDYQSDVKISNQILDQVSETYKKYRNCMRFLLGNLQNYQNQKFEFNELDQVDQYILIELDQVIEKSLNAYESYEFKNILQTLNTFITNILSSFYFDFIKDILYIQEVDNVRRQKVEFVLNQIFISLTKLLTPIIPHTSNEAYQNYQYNNQKFIFLEEMPEVKGYKNIETSKLFTSFLDNRDLINKEIESAREQKRIGKSLEAKVIIKASKDLINQLNQIDELQLMLIVSKLELVQADHFSIEVTKYTEHRCERCWKYYLETEINQNNLCDSCECIIKNIIER